MLRLLTIAHIEGEELMVEANRWHEKVDPRSRMAISYRGSTHSKVQSENKEIDLEEG